MLRTLSIATLLTASLAAAPAFAATVKIDLNGKSSDQIAAEVSKAAAYVCRDTLSRAAMPRARAACVEDTIAATNAKIAKVYASAPTASLASN
jgi:hypothetical protein